MNSTQMEYDVRKLQSVSLFCFDMARRASGYIKSASVGVQLSFSSHKQERCTSPPL